MFAMMTMAAAVAMQAPAAQRPQGPPDHHAVMAAQTDAMKPFAWLDGQWRGTAWSQTLGGRITLTQTERVGPFLGGSVKVVEGRGYDPKTGGTEFNAIGVIHYDPDLKAYTLNAVANGQRGTFPIVLKDNGFDWFIERGPVKIRYETRRKGAQWHETGFMALGDRPETKFFEMTLDRIGASDWPATTPVPWR